MFKSCPTELFHLHFSSFEAYNDEKYLYLWKIDILNLLDQLRIYQKLIHQI